MIEFNDGQKILAPRPADSRLEILNYEDLNDPTKLKYVYYGLPVFVINENIEYRCITLDGSKPTSLPQILEIPISNRKWVNTGNSGGNGSTIINTYNCIVDVNNYEENSILDINILEDTTIELTLSMYSLSNNKVFYTTKILSYIYIDNSGTQINFNTYGEIYPGQTDITEIGKFINPTFRFDYENNNVILNLINKPDSNTFTEGYINDLYVKINLIEI